MKKARVIRRSHQSLKSLVGMALQDWGSQSSWDAIYAFHLTGSPDTLALTRRLARSRNVRKRTLGMLIASQLQKRTKGAPLASEEYAVPETQDLLLNGLQDGDDGVIEAAISGFGHRPHPLALPCLIKFSSNPNQRIRYSVAFALGKYAEDDAIETLLQLMRDESAEVRDWATFAIGTLHVIDTPAIRDALWENLTDPDEDVKGEALEGLAARRDERAIPVLLSRLSTDSLGYELDAAKQMASPLLLDRLVAIRDAITIDENLETYWYNRLLSAIDACSVA